VILTEAEIVAITKRVRHKAQAEALRALGIPSKPRGDDSLVVARSAAEKALGGTLTPKAKTFTLDPETVA